jgi:hypothetical protein
MYMFFFYLYKVEELPFLLTRAGELDRLKDTVTKLDVFFRLSEDEDGVFELVKAWKTVSIVIPPLHRWGGEGVYCFTCVRSRYFSSNFSQQLLMAEI